MRFSLRATVVLSVLLPLSALGATSVLGQSRSLRQVDDINRNIQQDRRLQSLQQELEVRDNQLRQNIDRDRMFANPPPVPLPPSRSCPPGAPRCY
jgi:hypothetical protein